MIIVNLNRNNPIFNGKNVIVNDRQGFIAHIMLTLLRNKNPIYERYQEEDIVSETQADEALADALRSDSSSDNDSIDNDITNE